MRSIVWFCENVLRRQYLFAAQCASDWLVGLVQEISTSLRNNKRPGVLCSWDKLAKD